MTIINGINKYEIEGNTVRFYEKMGNRWVQLGPDEQWNDELIRELVEG